VWFGPLRGADWVSHNADAPHYAASTMKVVLVVAAYREAEAGRLDLDAPVAVHNRFRSAAGDGRFEIDRSEDSDPEPWRRLHAEVSLRWLCLRAIVCSSNLATNLVLESVGAPAVTEALAAVGADGSRVTRGIEDTDARDTGLQNVVTAHDLARTLQSLASGTAASPAGCSEILATLAAQQINDAIPAGLPRGTVVAHKSGWVEGISHDAGIVYPPDRDPYVFAMCTTSGLTEQASLDLIGAGAAASWADSRVAEPEEARP